MAEITKNIGARIVFDDDGVTVLSAFRTEVTRFVNDDGAATEVGRRDVDLTGEELRLFGATIDAHLTQTNARAATAEARVAQL